MADLRLLPWVYQVGGPHLTDIKDCSYFLIQDDPLVLIDCGTPDGIPSLQENLASIGASMGDIGLLLGTHGHYDHVGGASALKDLGAFAFCLHGDDRRAVEEGDGQLTAAEMMYHLPFPATAVDRQLEDGQIIELSQCRLTVVHTPGHTPGSCCILATWDGFTMLFAGDTVWGGFHPAFYAGIEAWTASLDKLLTYDFDVMVWGHSGSVLFGDAKQRVREARDSLGVFYVPWRIPVSGTELRYGGDALNPGRHESDGVP
jgi:glyoxylase-like metal-dependent hydrolase (beta-lactamase superfamily II)